ncbi:MAG: HAMP domain-containing histidine kinase [Clostridia bacterium]|nr:HAMP domain-containing histidine kinase [Clostridia bacterium]
MNKTKENKRHARLGIKWKMFAILAAFIIVALAVIWFFQVKMLNYFYLKTKFAELETSISKIETYLGEDEETLKNTVFECAIEYYSSIYVLEVRQGYATVMVEAEGTADTLMPIISDKDVIRLCNLAYENGGTYIATISSSKAPGFQKSEMFGEKPEDAIEDAMKKAKAGAVSAVHVKIVSGEDSDYLIIQNSDLTPVQATVKTLQRQFLWIGIILLLLALLLAVLLSKFITKPIIKINDAAKALARGKYDADFGVKGYREIGELSDTLNMASRELSKTDRLQKELIANVSHDLRTPLTMIKGYGEVMRDIPGENTPENVQVIIDETARLSELVNDMLDISRIQSGARVPALQVFCLTGVIRDTMARYEKLVTKDGYKIDFYADENVYVNADPSMILQVVYNLINNAVNYTGADKYVCVRQVKIGNKVRISVSDTGEGIASEQIPLIWDRYYKIDKVHKRAAVGTGLGLSIVKGIFELHGAAYGVDSKLGKGSAFWFELDCAFTEAEERQNG